MKIAPGPTSILRRDGGGQRDAVRGSCENCRDGLADTLVGAGNRASKSIPWLEVARIAPCGRTDCQGASNSNLKHFFDRMRRFFSCPVPCTTPSPLVFYTSNIETKRLMQQCPLIWPAVLPKSPKKCIMSTISLYSPRHSLQGTPARI
jgi:hypothetical protein